MPGDSTLTATTRHLIVLAINKDRNKNELTIAAIPYKVTKALRGSVRVRVSVVRVLGLVSGLVQSLDRNFNSESHHKFVTFRNNKTLWSNGISVTETVDGAVVAAK